MKIIIPIASYIKIGMAAIFLTFSLMFIYVYYSFVLHIVFSIIVLLLLLSSIKVLIIKENCIIMSSDIALFWFKVQYRTKVDYNEIESFKIIKRENFYSSRGREKTGRGFETRITGITFFEFQCKNKIVKRIRADVFSKKQLNYLKEILIRKNIMNEE